MFRHNFLKKQIWQVYSAAILLLIIALTLIVNCIPDLKDIDPPFVQLIYPLPGTVLSGSVSVVATATDNDEVREIRILIDGKVVFTSQTQLATFEWDTTPVADNLTHFISAVAVDQTDNVGNSATADVLVVKKPSSDIIDPIVTILNPVNGQLVAGLINIVAEPKDNVQIEKVEFYINGILDATVVSPPFQHIWNTSNLVKGSNHNIFLRAFDTNGNSSASQIIVVTVNSNVFGDLNPPAVAIINPPPNKTFFSDTTITVAVDAFDENGIDRVEFYVDGILLSTNFTPDTTSIYYWDWSLQEYGDGLDHPLYVKAYDNAQNTNVDLNFVQVKPAPALIPPSITIINPINGQTVSGIVKVVSDIVADRPIERVDLYIDGTLTDTTSQEPYNFLWDTSNLPNQSVHGIFTEVFDINGLSGKSPAITVTVVADVIPPTLSILFPPNGAIFSESTTDTINIIVDAFDENGIDKVEFFIDGILKHIDSVGSGTLYSYQWPLAGLGNGQLRTIFVKAFDNSQNTTSQQIVVTVNP